ncbi:penicillin-binding protein 2 [Yimella sp. cx-573]|nr:penicillin-binding protein 2 [Yimella sp. cx-573]
MNTPIRRLSVVVMAMFAALLIASTMIQFVQAKEYNDKPGNRRTLLASYAKERGSILVEGNAVATSTPTDNDFKWLRTYPKGTQYAAATGYFSFTYGTSGVERGYNDMLSGSSDKLFYRQLPDILTGKQPQGASVELTLRAKVQDAARKALGNQRGAVVALDPKTGAILAMVTSPTYDPNQLASHNLNAVQANWKRLLAAPGQPLVNRTISGNLYPPGSTFKLVTAAAALSSGKYQPDSELEGPAALKLPGVTKPLPNITGQSCGPDDKVSMKDALKISCNTAFASLGMDLGQDTVREQAVKFGFGQQLTIPMTVTPSRFPSDLGQAQLAQSAIGQYDVRVTPLQVAMISAAIANGGKVMRPYLVQNVKDKSLDVISSTDPSQLSTPISGDVANQLKDMMKTVVDSGTGRLAQIPNVEVAGKTGTAETAPGVNADVWFTGFAPVNDPKIAVAVVVENGGTAGQEASGGSVAAPIARQVMEAVVGQ